MVTSRQLVAAGALAGILATACSDDRPAPAAGAPASEVCGDEKRPRLQEGSHLLNDTPPPVPYSSVPPTSGWHRSGAPDLGVPGQPLSEPALVSALEAGHVVVAYDPQRTPSPTVERLEELATGDLADRLTVTAYDTPMPTALALVGWGVLRRCEELDEGALTAFVLQWFGAVSRDHADG